MRWLKRLLGRQQSHEEWLEAHPGKSSSKTVAPGMSAEEEQRTRATMEREMDAQREKRQQ